MPGLGRNIGDAYIQIHASTGPFRREVRREAGAAGDESGHEFDRSFGARLGRMKIGLSALKGSRNNFLNIVGSMSQGLENLFGKVFRESFASVGAVISGLGKTISQTDGPLSGFGKALDSIGQWIGRIGGGGIDGLIVQILALAAAFSAMIAIAGTAAAGISGIVGSLTALAVVLGGGLLGGIIALGPAMLAFSVGTTAARLAIAGLSKEQRKALKPLKDWVKEIQKLTGGVLFSDLGAQAKTLASVLSSTLNPLLVRSAGVLREFSDGFINALQGPQFSSVMDTLSAQLPNVLRSLLGIVSGLSSGLLGVFAAAAPGANRLFEGINRVTQGFSRWANSAEGTRQINTLMNQAVDILGSLWAIAKSVGATLSILWEEGRLGGTELLNSIRGVAQQFATWLGSTEGRDALERWFNNAVVIGKQLGVVIRQVVDLFNALDTEQTRAFFSIFVANVQGVITALIAVTGWVQTATTWFLDFGTQVGQAFVDIGNTIAAWSVGAVASVGNFVRFATVFFQGFIAGVRNVFGQIGNFVRSVSAAFTVLFVGAIQAVIGIFGRLGAIGLSVSRTITQAFVVGNRIFLTIATGIQVIIARFGGLRGAAVAALGAIVSTAVRVASGISTFFSNAINRIVGTFRTLLAAAQTAVSDILGAFQGIDLYSVGVNAIAGLLRGIRGAVGGLMAEARSIAGQIRATFENVLKIGSPSKVFDDIGRFLMLGLERGMKKRERSVRDTSSGIALSVINAAQSTINRAQGSIRESFAKIFDDLGSAGGGNVDKAFQVLGARAIHGLTAGLGNSREAAGRSLQKILEQISGITGNLLEKENKKVQASLRAQSEGLKEWVRSQGAALNTVFREIERASARIETARDRLKQLQDSFRQLRDSTAQSLRGELDLGAAVDDKTGTATFASVSSQVAGLAARMKTFARLLRSLVREGLPAALVQEVAALGSEEGIAVARALLSGNDRQRASLVRDFNSIQGSTRAIGTLLADQMFSAGIQAQKGLIRGLEANKRALEDAAARIARIITNKVKQELGIRSPSKVFQRLGGFITQGLALGIDGGARQVERSVSGLVDPNLMRNLNPSISTIAGQQAGFAGRGGSTIGGIEAGAITINAPFADPRLVAIETLDALASRGR